MAPDEREVSWLPWLGGLGIWIGLGLGSRLGLGLGLVTLTLTLILTLTLNLNLTLTLTVGHLEVRVMARVAEVALQRLAHVLPHRLLALEQPAVGQGVEHRSAEGGLAQHRATATWLGLA